MISPATPARGAPSDHDLLAAIAMGDLDALGALFERYEPATRRYLGRLGLARTDVDDLIQATFLEVVRAAERFDSRFSVQTWLLGIATMMVRRHRRSAARIASRIAAWAGLVHGAEPRAPSAHELFEQDEAIRVLARALERLPSGKREAFVLVTLEGLSGEEAARVLGIPVRTVWTRLHYARRELRAALGGDP